MPSRVLGSLVLFSCACAQHADGEGGVQREPAAPFEEPATVRVPAGSFTMGSPEDELGRYPDEVQHRVTIAHDLLMGTTSVTQEQFASLMGYQSAPIPGSGVPVTNITWHEAAAFTNALSSASGLDPCYRCEGEGVGVDCRAIEAWSACEGWRLPTEAEREYAARGGLEAQAFPNGGKLEAGDGLNCRGPITLTDGSMLGDVAWHCGVGGGVKPAALLAPNGYGLYDMSGNIWEWCHDWHAPYTGDATDPAGPATGEERVVRGGSAKLYYPQHLRVAFRLAVIPTTRAPQLGFRMVRTGG